MATNGKAVNGKPAPGSPANGAPAPLPEASIFEASIASLQAALSSGHTNAVQLAAQHLCRIAQYDRRGPRLDSVPVLNLALFEDAQASDEHRAQGTVRSGLEGIPCTIKDSYMVKGMTIAAGSPAFQDLMADEDAFVVARIREGGGVVLGKTNMPPMAAGGMQRGGRAESPYNASYLTAAFASGSSSGSASATAASLGVFGIGEETISSGRSPASNNSLVAYTPSRGILSICGNWPLFANCDTVVPHTRSVADMLTLLDVIATQPDTKTRGDFWRAQPFVKLGSIASLQSGHTLYSGLKNAKALEGKRLGVPKMYIGKCAEDPAALPVHVAPSVIQLWDRARATLEQCGAVVEEVDFPLVTKFEGEAYANKEKPVTPYFTPVHHNEIDLVQLMARTWDDFLAQVDDKISGITTLANVDPAQIFPRPPGTLPDRYAADDPLARHEVLVDTIKKKRENGDGSGVFDTPGLGEKLQALEDRRKRDLEDWMDARGLDAVVWPCAGDVGRADADKNEESARDAWRNGVLYSNGNCAIRQFGVPTVNVPMGLMYDTGMPVNLTFAGRAYDDQNLLRFGYAFEQSRRGRTAPPRTPALPTDAIPADPDSTMIVDGKRSVMGQVAPILETHAHRIAPDTLEVWGSVGGLAAAGGLQRLDVFVDGVAVERSPMLDGLNDEKGQDTWKILAGAPNNFEGPGREKDVPDQSQAMVVVVLTAKNGRSAGSLLFV